MQEPAWKTLHHNFWKFYFALAPFLKKNSKKFWRLTENPGKSFLDVREKSENYF